MSPSTTTDTPLVAAGRSGDGSAVSALPYGRPEEVRLSWEGDLDVASAPVLTKALHVLSDLGVRTVVLDVSVVAFMDCAGLGALLDADSRLDDGLRLAGPSRAVLRLLALVDLVDRFPLEGEPTPVSRLTDTRMVIEQSKGLIMGSYGCTLDQADKILVSTALRRNVQVQVLSALLVTVTSPELAHPLGGAAEAVHQVMELAEATV